MAAVLAALISAAWLPYGFSPYDDGAYAWALREIMDGRVPHRDFAYAHPGYVLWLLQPLAPFLAQDILHYRYVLPLLAGVSALSVAWLLRGRGPLVAVSAGVAVSAFGFVQFATYSASWLAVTATAVTVALVGLDCERRAAGGGRVLLLAGLAAGLAFGFRAPNGVAAVMAALLLLFQVPSTEAARNARAASVAAAAVMVVAAGGILLLVDNLERLLLLMPPLVACVTVAIRLWRGEAGGLSAAVAWFSCGFVLAITPLLVWALSHGMLADMLRDLFLVPGAISNSNRDYGATGAHGLMTELMVVLSGPVGPVDLLNASIYLFALAFPLLLLAMRPRGGVLPPVWVLAAFSCIGIAVLPQLIYAFYVWPFVAAAWLERAGRPRVAAWVVLVISCLFLFVSPRGLYPGSHGLQPQRPGQAETASARWEPMACPLDRCSVRSDPRAMQQFAEDVRILRTNVGAEEPLLVLESFAAYAHFLPNPSPFTLGRSDNRGTYGETSAYRQAFMSDPALVVAVPTVDRPMYAGLLRDYCPERDVGRWVFLTRCAP